MLAGWGSQFVGEVCSFTLGTCYAPKDGPHNSFNLGDPSLLGKVVLSLLFVLGAAGGHHDWFSPFCVLLNVSHPGFFSAGIFVCLFLGAAGGHHGWFGPFCFLLNVSHPGFFLQAYLFVCSWGCWWPP